ncbi:S-ribosylhomocysteine lyase [Acetilactobacillus jinshanensis]|uniref:S-ribosylhomocysteine lyase n=1 Tax=Acetilactobacillus jinshanensis TaxID=1720083 RepID=A0A4P6ZLH9_9LACO|nr:S-ribosylhomocysteine lyase [Acetilactobacillus jinshanensis]QBP18433.1 S-ribosylhomocysteine lyase [Acetilactobacillus jinshanensis]URL61304.1 S-ribosylhomocysteine lyase [uncultured bacterium]
MAKVESFSLDHTKVKAPYVRLIDTSNGPKGDVISNFDVRVSQPNKAYLPTAGFHTLEHLFAKYFPKYLKGYVACSTFGCGTGFHLILWGEHSTTEVAKAEKKILELIANKVTWKDIPRVNEHNCANVNDLSLFSVKWWAKRILNEKISTDPYVRKPI